MNRFRIIPFGALREAYRQRGGAAQDPTERWIGRPCAVGSIYRPVRHLRLIRGGRVARIGEPL